MDYGNVYNRWLHGWLGQQWLHQSNYLDLLEISSTYNPFSSRFPFPVAIHCHNVCRVNGLHNIPPLLPPGVNALVSCSQTAFFFCMGEVSRPEQKAVWLCKTINARVQNSWHLLEYKLFKAIPTL